MAGRRWLLGATLVIATLLLVGRVVAGWYVDFLWFDALGAAEVWRARTVDLLILRGGAFVVGTIFVFLNLYAVRHSVVSLVLPRRVGNLEIGEEVHGRYLDVAVITLSIVVGILLAVPHGDWASVDLVRHGESFRESDPYFQFDLAFWVYWLPLEAEFHLWSLIAILAITFVVTCLYALTPSLRWEGGRFRITAYVRRHFFALGAALLVILAWSYRLDAYRLLLEGSGAQGTFNAIDHRIGIPASLALALGTVAAAMLLLWSGWVGQFRIAFAAVSTVLLLALSLRQLLPAVAERFLTPVDQEQRDAPYLKTRMGYTRRAYAVDRVVRQDSIGGEGSVRMALRGAALWDSPALERAMAHERRVGSQRGSLGWVTEGERLRSLFVEEPTSTDASSTSAPWSAVRIDADLVSDRGAPVTDGSFGGDLTLPPVLVLDATPGYRVVRDSTGSIAAPGLERFGSRLAHAWRLQDPRLLQGDAARDGGKVVMYRDVRQRVRRLFPFFLQGRSVTPIVHRDSLYWSIPLYATSAFYPLSDPVRVVGDEVRYLQHAGVAIVSAHTGRAFVIADAAPDPITASWMRRFPRLFVPAPALARELTDQVVPPAEGAELHARMYAYVGARGENAPPSHLPRQTGGDTTFAAGGSPPFVDPVTGKLSVAWPVLDGADRVRGVIVASGGADYDVRWEGAARPGPRWGTMMDKLQRAIDSASQGAASPGATSPGATSREAPLVRGPVRVIPHAGGEVFLQTAYARRSDGSPVVRLVAVAMGDTVRTGATIAAAAGLPMPTLPSTPLTPAAFRARVEALYGEMREAMARGDWLAFGNAYDALGRVLRATPAKP